MFNVANLLETGLALFIIRSISIRVCLYNTRSKIVASKQILTVMYIKLKIKKDKIKIKIKKYKIRKGHVQAS